MGAWVKPLLLAVVVAGLAGCGDGDGDGDEQASPTTDHTHAPGEVTDHTRAEGDGAAAHSHDVNPCADGATPLPSEEPVADATPVTITAVDYEFSGTDQLAVGGPFAITFVNDGVELHELVVQRLADGDDRNESELVAAHDSLDGVDVAHGFACPGASTVVNADLSEPGRYLVACHVEVGTTPETDPSDFAHGGRHHAENGMLVVVEVA